MLEQWWEKILDVLYPPLCCACGRTLARDLPFCVDCANKLRLIQPPVCPVCGLPFAAREGRPATCGRCVRRRPAFRQARAGFVYAQQERDDPLARAVSRFKYGRLSSLARPLGALLRYAAPMNAYAYDCVVPVPLHPSRLRWRGFNQALLLARAAFPAARVESFALQRVRATPPQVELPRKQRLANVHRAFAVSPSHRRRLERARVLLVDDVMTTGATLHHCSVALRRAGVELVDALVLARAVLS